MDMYAAGLTPIFFPAAKVIVVGHENEDEFYAAYGWWTTPAWIVWLAAVLRGLRQVRPVDTITTQTA